MRVFLFTDRSFQRNRILCDLLDLTDTVDRHIQLFCDLFRQRFPAQLLQQNPRRTRQTVDRLHHMHGDSDRARLVCDRARDRLTDPPRRIRGKFESFLIVKLFHRFHQSEVAFLDQIQKQHPASDIPLRNGNNQPQVCLRQALLRRFIAFLHLARQLDLFIHR